MDYSPGLIPNIPATIKIKRLRLQDTGRFNQMYARPFVTNVDQYTLNTIESRINANGPGKITNNIFNGLGTNLVAPSPTVQGQLQIPNGWNENRLRFVMEVSVTTSTGAEMIYYFQGYTTHAGITPNGNVDPRMDFIVNSYMQVNRIKQFLAGIGEYYTDQVVASSQIINGQLSNLYTTPAYGTNAFYTMRPTDIFTGLQSNQLEAGYRMADPTTEYLDTRFRTFGEPVVSRRSNSNPNMFLASVVDVYNASRQMAGNISNGSDIFSTASQMTHDGTITENPFFRCLMNIKGVTQVQSFSYADLAAIDPGVYQATDYNYLGPMQAQMMSQNENCESWTASNYETMAATLLSNSIPALMQELFISKAVFQVTNDNIGMQAAVQLIDMKSLSNADMRPNFELFKMRLVNEILYDLSQANQVQYKIQVNADLFGQTTIDLSLNGESFIRYLTPSFCDSIITPVVTTSRDNFYGVVHDLDIITNQLIGSSTPNFDFTEYSA